MRPVAAPIGCNLLGSICLLDADDEGVDELPIGYELIGKVAVDQAGLDLCNTGFETLVWLSGWC